jgi:RNA polymerase sigma factor (sigma-70 family)
MNSKKYTKDIASLIEGWRIGDAKAVSILNELSYIKIKELTAHYREKENAFIHHTALAIESVTDLTHDVYVKFLQSKFEYSVETIHDFYQYLTAMVVNNLRDNLKKHLMTLKRDVNKTSLTSNAALNQVDETAKELENFISLEKSIDDLSKAHSRQANAFKLKYFIGMSNKEIGGVHQTSTRTVDIDIKFAKSWLQVQAAS